MLKNLMRRMSAWWMTPVDAYNDIPGQLDVWDGRG